MSNQRLRRSAEQVAEIRYEPATFEVTRGDIAKFASAIGSTDPIYFDREAARAAGHDDVVAPRFFYFGLGTARGRFLPPERFSADGMPSDEKLENARLVLGGSSALYFDDIHAGDTITVEQEVGRVSEREGRSGPLVLVDLHRSYLRPDGSPVATETLKRVLR